MFTVDTKHKEEYMMIRKILTAILCLAMALALPLASLAATETTVSVAPGSAYSSIPMLNDLLDALSLSFVSDEDATAGSFSLRISGQDALTIAARVDKDALYIDNVILGDDPVCLPFSDIEKLFKEAMKASGMDEAAFASLEEALSGIMSGKPVNRLGLRELKGLSFTEKMEQLKTVFAADSAMVAYIDDIQQRMKVTDGVYTSHDHDVASQKWELTITKDDYMKLFETDYVKSAFRFFARASGGEFEVDELLDAMNDAMKDVDINAQTTMYTYDKGKVLVSFETTVAVTGTVDSVKEIDGSMTTTKQAVNTETAMAYNRLTSKGVTSHLGTMTMMNDGEQMMTARFKMDESDENAKGTLGMLVDGTEMNVGYEQTLADDVTTREISLYMRENATSLLEPAAYESPIFTVKVENKPNDGSGLQKVLNATVGSSIQPLIMGQDEMQTYLSGLLTRAQQTLFNIISMLPESVVQNLGTLMN